MQDINLLIKPGLKAKNIVNCKNQAIKRVLIDRFGFKKLINELHGTVINQYKKSKLIKIDIKENENLVVVKVVCPSTNDTYLLRVPPSMKNFQQAIAWTFGLNKEDYNPVKET